MNSGIYKIINSINGKIYIGSSSNLSRRFTQHKSALFKGKHSNKYLQRSWIKHGPQAFFFVVIAVVPVSELIKIENQYLQEIKPEYNLNIAYPTRLGSKATPDLRLKLSLAHKGKPSPKKGIKTGIPAWNKGLKFPNLGTFMRALHKGKRRSPKTEFKKGYIVNKDKLRPIICLELQMCFRSITDAARFCGNANYCSNINAVCNNRQKTAYGYTWQYINLNRV